MLIVKDKLNKLYNAQRARSYEQALQIEGTSGIGKDATISAFFTENDIKFVHLNAGIDVHVDVLMAQARKLDAKTYLVVSEANLLSVKNFKALINVVKSQNNLSRLIITTNPAYYTGRNDAELEPLYRQYFISCQMQRLNLHDVYLIIKGMTSEVTEEMSDQIVLQKDLAMFHMTLEKTLLEQGSAYLPST